MRLAIAVLALLLAADAAAQAPPPAEAPATPVWRRVLMNLPADRALIAGCLASEAGHATPAACAPVVGEACLEAAEPAASGTTSLMRWCNWRAIAAWEEELAEARAALRAGMRPEELAADDAADAAFKAFVDANAHAYAAEFEGGTHASVAAGAVRARMLAERALEFRARRMDLAEDAGPP
jgi:hypothetical protein